MSLLVHGITRTKAAEELDLDDLREQRGSDVSLVANRDLTALTSEVDGDEVLPTRALLLGHARLLEGVAAVTTVVPMRFGVCVPSVDVLRRDVLAGQRQQLADTLDRLRDVLELRFRGRYDEPTVLREVLASDRQAAQLHRRTDTASRIHLGERIAAALEARRRRDLARAQAAIMPHVDDHRPADTRGPMDAFAIAALVRTEARDAFERSVEEFAQHMAPTLEVELVGPMPAYSFVEQRGPAWDS